MSIYDLNSIGICIDEYDCGEMKGRVFSSLHSEPDQFNSVITLVKTIDSIFDEGEFPQATMRCRGFGKKAAREAEGKASDRQNEAADPIRVNPMVSNARGRKATFSVRVMFRQNASWQGTVCWLEKNREENFRSVLEMMMLIDSAFESEAALAADTSKEQKVVNR